VTSKGTASSEVGVFGSCFSQTVSLVPHSVLRLFVPILKNRGVVCENSGGTRIGDAVNFNPVA
jgi:hypothetical protein